MSRKKKTIPVFVPHLGCPCDCLFCDQKKITGVQEEMTPEKAKKIIEVGICHKKPEEYLEIGFFGGSFTGIPASMQEGFLSLAYEALLRGDVDGIRLSTRPDYINGAVLERLLRFGVTTVELGAQSMDDGVLAKCRRGHDAEATRKAARMIKQSGLGLGLQMMVGLPGDTEEITAKTAKEFGDLLPDCVRIYPTLVIRGTALDELLSRGEYVPLTVEEAVKRCSFLYRYFTERNIDVIRMGLLQMNPEDVSAGPVHPAFGELVQSEVFYEKLSPYLVGLASQTVEVCVNPRYVSIACGQKKMNVKRLQKDFNLENFYISPNEQVPWGEFLIWSNKERVR